MLSAGPAHDHKLRGTCVRYFLFLPPLFRGHDLHDCAFDIMAQVNSKTKQNNIVILTTNIFSLDQKPTSSGGFTYDKRNDRSFNRTNFHCFTCFCHKSVFVPDGTSKLCIFIYFTATIFFSQHKTNMKSSSGTESRRSELMSYR